MSKKKFNPKEWENKNPVNLNNLDKIKVQTNNPQNDIETITKRIEETNTDIAPNYADWRDLGFALADALGESGRTYYHRLSHFYSGYTETETNKQYDNCLKSHGHGNYSDGFRKAFHHEKISYLRRKDREYITLENPKLSALLSGTPRQVQSLIPDAENGLFSRFMFYCMNIRLQWTDVFAINGNESLDQRFDRFGNTFFDFYRTLKQYENIHFSLSSSQQTAFNQYFEQVQQQYWELLGNDYIGTIRRLGLITFRIAMILTTLRIMDNHSLSPLSCGEGSGVRLVCSDTDFQIAMEILKVLLQHAAFVFKQLPHANATQTAQNTNPKMALFQALPAQFDRTKYLEIATQLQIPESTANKQIARFCNAGLLIRQTHGNYIKKTE